jgi:hypothetical protein
LIRKTKTQKWQEWLHHCTRVSGRRIPGLENVVPVFGQWITSIEIKRENKIFTKDDPGKIVATDASYFDMLPYKWLAGNKATALNTHNKVVLTESRTKEYFPDKAPQDILNETIVYYGWKDTVMRTVSRHSCRQRYPFAVYSPGVFFVE